MANGYSSESTRQELSNEYQYDKVKIILMIFCFFVDWVKVTSAAEGLRTIWKIFQLTQIYCSLPEGHSYPMDGVRRYPETGYLGHQF